MRSFTLIEVIIAIFILGTGIVAVLSIFPMGTQIQKSAQMASTASQLGQAKMEELISKSYGEISVATTTEAQLDSPFESYKRVTKVNYWDPVNSTITDSDSGIKKIEITVSWKSPLGVTEKSININSLIAKR